MAEVCREVQDAVESTVVRPIETWVGQFQQTCAQSPCIWWCLCCNKWFCWLAWIIVRIVTLVAEVVVVIVTRIVCEVIALVVEIVLLLLRLALMVVQVILAPIVFLLVLLSAIPVIGGIIRTVFNWVIEIGWRVASIPEFIASWAGYMPPKWLYTRAVILRTVTGPVSTPAVVDAEMATAKAILKAQCNIELVFLGTCTVAGESPSGALKFACDAGGFVGTEFWLPGSYYTYVSASCSGLELARAVAPITGTPLTVIVIESFLDGKAGCSWGNGADYVTVSGSDLQGVVGGSPFAAHEIGHACGLLWHDSDPNNLMFGDGLAKTAVRLNAFQRSVIRTSRHCTYV